MPRVAAIDCGTNSLRLLIADVDPVAGTLADVDRDMIVVRLGQGVDRTGRLADDALDRAFAIAEEYATRCRRQGVEAIRFVATSATRDASNREVFVRGIEERLGVLPEVIPGPEEARLSFRGATTSLGHRHQAPFLVVDIGGGSTEFVLGGEEAESACSVDIGCVRLTERHLHSDPPTDAELEAATRDIRQALDHVSSVVEFSSTKTLVGLAGSVTTVTAHALALDSYRPDRIHGSVLALDDAVRSAADLIGRTHLQRAQLGFMHPGRVDVIGGGALIWREIVLRVRQEVRDAGSDLDSVMTSEHDMLDGIAWALAEEVSRPKG